MRDLPPRSSRPHNAIPSPLVISTGHRDIFSLCHLDRSRSACDDAVERSRGWRQNHADLGSFLEASFVALSSQRTRGHQLVELGGRCNRSPLPHPEKVLSSGLSRSDQRGNQGLAPSTRVEPDAKEPQDATRRIALKAVWSEATNKLGCAQNRKQQHDAVKFEDSKNSKDQNHSANHIQPQTVLVILSQS